MDGIIFHQPSSHALRPPAFKTTAVQADASARSDDGGSVPVSHTLWHLHLRNQFTCRGCRQALPRDQATWQKRALNPVGCRHRSDDRLHLVAVAEQPARCGDSPRPRGLDGCPRIDGWIWDTAAGHRSANSQLDRPRVVQLPYTSQLKSSVAVLPRSVSGRVCIAGGQAEGLGDCVAEPGRPIGPGVPPTRLVLDPGGPDSLARGSSSRIAKRYQPQNVSGLQALKTPRTIPR